jgi:hypothetical protein
VDLCILWYSGKYLVDVAESTSYERDGCFCRFEILRSHCFHCDPSGDGALIIHTQGGSIAKDQRFEKVLRGVFNRAHPFVVAFTANGFYASVASVAAISSDRSIDAIYGEKT